MTAEVSKLNAYAVLVGGAAQVSKLNAYAVLIPPPPTSVHLATTETRDTAAFVLAGPTSVALAATETRDTAAFFLVSPMSAVLAATETNDVAVFHTFDFLGARIAATEGRDTASFQFAPFGFPALTSPGLGWSVHRRPTFDTIVATHQSGSEVRFALWANCLWEFELTFDGLAGDVASYPGLGVNSYQALLGMALTLGGTHSRFLYVDPDFNTLTNQAIGAGDGTTTAFPLVRAIGGAVEPISWATGVSAVTVAGIGAAFTMASPSVVNLATPPASGALVAASFTYGFVCRLLEDTEDFEEFMFNLWQVKSFKFRQVRL